MKIILFLALLFVFESVFNFAQTISSPPPPLIWSAPDKNDLKQFTPDDKSFAIALVGEATIVRDVADVVSTVSYRAYRKGEHTTIDVNEYPDVLENDRPTVYSLVRDKISKVGKTVIEKEIDIEVNGIPARDFYVDDGFVHGKIRVVIAGKRVYVLIVDVTNWHILKPGYPQKVTEFEKEIDRFFSSFKILK